MAARETARYSCQCCDVATYSSNDCRAMQGVGKPDSRHRCRHNCRQLTVRNSGTPAAYEFAATALGVALCEIRLVAAHRGVSPARWHHAALHLSLGDPESASSRSASQLMQCE